MLQAIKNVAKNAHLNSAYMCFSQGSITERLVKKITTDKLIQRLLKVTTPIEYKKYMVSTNVE